MDLDYLPGYENTIKLRCAAHFSGLYSNEHERFFLAMDYGQWAMDKQDIQIINVLPMPLHEQKNCPRCNAAFECRAGDISNCGCNGITLTAEEKAFIETRYSDCLCPACLKDLQNKQTLFKEKFLQ